MTPYPHNELAAHDRQLWEDAAAEGGEDEEETMNRTTLDRYAVLDTVLIRTNASVPIGRVPSRRRKLQAITATAVRLGMSEADTNQYLARMGLAR